MSLPTPPPPPLPTHPSQVRGAVDGPIKCQPDGMCCPAGPSVAGARRIPVCITSQAFSWDANTGSVFACAVFEIGIAAEQEEGEKGVTAHLRTHTHTHTRHASIPLRGSGIYPTWCLMWCRSSGTTPSTPSTLRRSFLTNHQSGMHHVLRGPVCSGKACSYFPTSYLPPMCTACCAVKCPGVACLPGPVHPC